ncbi:MAG: hypothetical protein DWQ37_09980 [Planctomycetota bacterium]|nr:MAG: hypothetical protein DWQ37_09980 [Planctomycetota bacterium]
MYLFRILSCPAVTAAALFATAINRAYAGAEDFHVPAGQRQLFVDDHGVAQIDNLTRHLHAPEKRGAVIRSPQPKDSIQTRTAPVWDPQEEVYKLWVLGIDENLWQSRDGLHWTPGPETNMRIHMAVYDPGEEDPDRRFKAPLLNKGFAASPDGVTWTELDVPKIQSSDEGNFSYDAENGLFVHTVKRGGTHGRAVALATSRDFETWDDYGLVFEADDVDQQRGRKDIEARRADKTLEQTLYNDPAVYNVDVYNMGVFRYEGLYLGLPAMFHATGPVPNYPNTDGFHLVELVCSRDLKDWQRLGDRQPFIAPSRIDSGAYDLTQILPPSAPVVRDDELWFYYTGLKWRSTFDYFGTYPDGKHVPKAGRDRDVGAVCLAVLRRDGFISLDADETEGTLLTEPFTLPADKLLLNVDAQDGELRVEACDEAGQVLAESQAIRGDHPREEVAWQPGGISDLSDRRVRLRFTLRNASLYSYWLGE